MGATSLLGQGLWTQRVETSPFTSSTSRQTNPTKFPPCLGTSAKLPAVAFSPDGTMVATGSLDRTILVWRVATPFGEQSLWEKRSLACLVSFSSVFVVFGLFLVCLARSFSRLSRSVLLSSVSFGLVLARDCFRQVSFSLAVFLIYQSSSSSARASLVIRFLPPYSRLSYPPLTYLSLFRFVSVCTLLPFIPLSPPLCPSGFPSVSYLYQPLSFVPRRSVLSYIAASFADGQ